MLCTMLGVKRELQRDQTFLVYQDNPGEGFQASIFKRFYWWEDECTQRMLDKFGVTIVKQSFRELGPRRKAIPDERPTRTWRTAEAADRRTAGRARCAAPSRSTWPCAATWMRTRRSARWASTA